MPRCGALSLLKMSLKTRVNSNPNGTEANDASRSVCAWRGSQNLSGAEVWAAAFVHVLVLLAAGLALCFGESINLT